MSEKTILPLTQLRGLLLEGKDVLNFLQGQCTQDVKALTAHQPVLGAFCTAKGRTVTNVQLVLLGHEPDRVLMICHSSVAEALFNHLKKYAAFFRGMQFTLLPHEIQAYGINLEGTQTIASEFLQNESVLTAFPWGKSRAMVWCGSNDADELLNKSSVLTENEWSVQDILEQKLWLDEHQLEAWIPQNVSLDDLGGISFKKGCYTGQEVVARLHFKGQSKKRLFTLHCPEAVKLSEGKLERDGKAVGDIVQSATNDDGLYALAVLKLSENETELYSSENQQVAFQLLH